MLRFVCLLAGVATLSCGGADRVRVIKLAHGLPTSHPVHEAMVFLAEEASDQSHGAIRIDVHPAEQLGTERECLELLQIGAVGMTKVSASVLENFVPRYAVFSLPYLFRDEAHRQKVFHGDVGKEILEAGEDKGLRGLTYYDAGSRSFYSKEKPILSPADLDGLKIRTQESSLAIGMVQSLGGAATPHRLGRAVHVTPTRRRRRRREQPAELLSLRTLRSPPATTRSTSTRPRPTCS